ncbi:Lrp/AsnC family transcriptional regulator [Egicoccus halophilus]|uniref:AsnC family transcriptional regulator n=1 Tax=Egicoccus halophilus TaxID=1670830 RepID=A0A8J3A5A7_9ACTN|nr:Lrp/AsnC family transcriptional regulator [Egicoccus halophilus]GGI03280.1 AsnC family transcriptional regulator [Egicoccus halophilus]
MRLDALDRRIVAWLSSDGRASYREIGDDIGLSAPAVKRRVDRLLDAGVIERFAAVIDPRALGWATEAFIELFCEGRTPPSLIGTALSRYPEVVGAYTITGDPDALVHVRASDTAHLEATLEQIRSEPFVARTRSVLVLSRLLERQPRPTGPGS